MQGELPPPVGPAADVADSLLAGALRCRSDSAPLRVGALLAELAGAFQVPGAGVAQLPGGEPVAGQPDGAPLPWRQRPDLLREAALAPTALAVHDDELNWLLTG